MNRSVMCETIVQTLSHLGSVTVDSLFVEPKSKEIVVLTKIVKPDVHNGTRDEYATHRGCIYTHPEERLSLESGHYFAGDQYAEAQEDYFDRTKAAREFA
jgi:hypothetical protein